MNGVVAPLTKRRARQLVRLMLEQQGPGWLPRYRAVWSAWREMHLPEWDQVPADRLLSALGLLCGAVDGVGKHVDGRRATPVAVRAALGLTSPEELH